MRISWAAAASALVLALVFGAAARADEFSHQGGPHGSLPVMGETTIGVGMICDTPEQAARFVTLRAAGRAPQQAMEAVNSEARKARACGVAAVAFIPDHTTDMKIVAGRLVHIVRISVIAGFNGAVWRRVAGTVQYAVIEAAGESI